MVVRGWRWRRSRATLKKFLFLLLLLSFLGRFGVHLIHLEFLGLRQRREVADERDEFPAIGIVVGGRAKCGHSAQHDSILNNVVYLAVRHVLRLFAAHIGWARVHCLSIHGVSTAVVRVAGCTVVCP